MSLEALTLSFRPKRFSEIVGQKKVLDKIRGHALQNRLPKSWMFSGETGAGKTTIARVLAMALQCRHQKPEAFGEPCDECLAKKGWDIIETNASESTTKDDIEAIVKSSTYFPRPPSRRRVYIFDEAQRMSAGAQNLLLDYFEDGSAKTSVFIICTSEPTKIIKALRRRCTRYALAGLGVNGLERLVNKTLERAKAPAQVKAKAAELCEALNEKGISSPGLVVQAVERLLAGNDIASASNVGFDGESGIDTLEICRAVTRGNWIDVRTLLKKASNDDSRIIRASVAGYLKAILLNESIGKKADKISISVMMLNKLYLDDGGGLAALIGALYEITASFAR